MKTREYTRKLLWRGALAVILAVSMLVSTSVMCFAGATALNEEDEKKVDGITGVNISLSESIVVKFHTTAICDDGSKLEVTFKGKTYEITENEDGVFSFAYVTPQYMGEELVATMYDAKGAKIGEEKKLSVKSNLEDLLKLSYEESGCGSELQYQAMRELCVNILNYGAAAQTYFNCNVDNLVNAGLSDEQKALATEKITVNDTDKAKSGDAWVGAGVRFDYKLGLYFVFTAASADEYTATINGETVTPEVYEALGEGYYVIRYSRFNATNMNNVVTAKLTKNGAEDQTFSYSIKSYVAAKGGDDSAIAKLVNATYVYGYAAVAYLQEYAEVTPTFDAAGSLSIDGKGYDFSGSKYGEATVLPKLDLVNYTAVSKNIGTLDTEPKIVTCFTLKSEDVDYTAELTPENAIWIGEQWYSEYDLANFTSDDVTVEYDKSAKSYTLTAPTDKAVSLTNLSSLNAPLTVTGKVTVTHPNVWRIYGPINIGTETKTAEITRTGGELGYQSVFIFDRTLVSKGSMLDTQGSAIRGHYNCQLIIDGTVNAGYETGRVIDITRRVTDITENYSPFIYIRSGTLKTGAIRTDSIQVGDEDNAGTLIVKHGGSNKAGIINPNNADGLIRFDFVNGKVIANGPSNTASSDKAILHLSTTGDVRLYIGKNMTFETETPLYYSCLIAAWGDMSNRYYTIDADAKLFVDADGNALTSESGNFIRAYNGSLITHIEAVQTKTVKIDGAEKEVRLLHKACNLKKDINQATFNGYFSTVEGIADGTELTAKSGTWTVAYLGEFKKATLADGTELWYQEIT